MAEQGKHITRTEEMNAKVARVLQRGQARQVRGYNHGAKPGGWVGAAHR